MASINAAVVRAGRDSQRVHGADEMAAFRETFRATGEPDARNYAPWQFALANASLTSPICTLQRILAATGGTSAAGRSYGPEESAAIRATFEAPNEPALTRAFSTADMAKIKAAFYSRDVSLAGGHLSAVDADSALAIAGGKKSDSHRKSGEGSVTVTPMPRARVEGTLIVKGGGQGWTAAIGSAASPTSSIAAAGRRPNSR